MHDLMEAILKKERDIKNARKGFEQERETEVARYREQAHAEIGEMKSVYEAKRKQYVAEAQRDADVKIALLDQEAALQKQQHQIQYEANKDAAFEILLKEVLFDGNR